MVHLLKVTISVSLVFVNYEKFSKFIYPVDNYLFKLAIETLEKGIKYVQGL